MKRTLWRCTRGATAVEYALIIGLIALPLVPVMPKVFTAIEAAWHGALPALSSGGEQ